MGPACVSGNAWGSYARPMITPAQHRQLVKQYQSNGGVVSHAAMKANMHPETAARYLKANASPEEIQQQRGPRAYRTRPDPLKDVMPEAVRYLEAAPEIEVKGLLAHLKASKPELAGTIALRTFQRGVKVWRALNGPPKEVFFPQAHEPLNSGSRSPAYPSSICSAISCCRAATGSVRAFAFRSRLFPSKPGCKPRTGPWAA